MDSEMKCRTRKGLTRKFRWIETDKMEDDQSVCADHREKPSTTENKTNK